MKVSKALNYSPIDCRGHYYKNTWHQSTFLVNLFEVFTKNSKFFLFFERSKNQYFSTFFNKKIYIFQTKNIPPCSQAPGWLFDTTRWSLPSFSQVIKAGRKKVVFAEVPRSMWRRGRRKLKILFLNSATSKTRRSRRFRPV